MMYTDKQLIEDIKNDKIIINIKNNVRATNHYLNQGFDPVH